MVPTLLLSKGSTNTSRGLFREALCWVLLRILVGFFAGLLMEAIYRARILTELTAFGFTKA